MHPERSADSPAGVARPGTPEFEHQRRVLLELAVDPPPEGMTVTALTAELELTIAQAEQAAVGLERAGLVERREDRLSPTPPLRAVEVLWPIGL